MENWRDGSKISTAILNWVEIIFEFSLALNISIPVMCNQNFLLLRQ